MGPGPSVCCMSGREPGYTLGCPEAQAVGAVDWGQGPLFCGLLAIVAGNFLAATRTPPPRSRPWLGGLCSPPTPVTCFSGVWWRAEWPWRLSGSWRTGEPPRCGSQLGLASWSQWGLARGCWSQSWLPCPASLCGGSGCLGPGDLWVALQEPTMHGGAAQLQSRRDSHLNKEGPLFPAVTPA